VEYHILLSIAQDHPSARLRASGLPSPSAGRLGQDDASEQQRTGRISLAFVSFSDHQAQIC